MNRRGFLTAMLAAGAAPAVCKAENLMKIFVPPEPKIVTLSSLAADFDGDVMAFDFETNVLSDVHMSHFQRKMANNAVYGAHARYPRGMNPYMAHIDEAAFWPDPKRADRDYFKAWVESNGNLEQTHRRLVTPRRDRTLISIRTDKSPEETSRLIEATIRQIKPQPGPLEVPKRRGLRGLLGLA